MIEAKFTKIKGGYLAVIEFGDDRFVFEKFKELNNAVNWVNAFCEGYTKALEYSGERKSD